MSALHIGWLKRQSTGGALMGDKSPKSKDKAKKQGEVSKGKKAAEAKAAAEAAAKNVKAGKK